MSSQNPKKQSPKSSAALDAFVIKQLQALLGNQPMSQTESVDTVTVKRYLDAMKPYVDHVRVSTDDAKMQELWNETKRVWNFWASFLRQTEDQDVAAPSEDEDVTARSQTRVRPRTESTGSSTSLPSAKRAKTGGSSRATSRQQEEEEGSEEDDSEGEVATGRRNKVKDDAEYVPTTTKSGSLPNGRQSIDAPTRSTPPPARGKLATPTPAQHPSTVSRAPTAPPPARINTPLVVPSRDNVLQSLGLSTTRAHSATAFSAAFKTPAMVPAPAVVPITQGPKRKPRPVVVKKEPVDQHSMLTMDEPIDIDDELADSLASSPAPLISSTQAQEGEAKDTAQHVRSCLALHRLIPTDDDRPCRLCHQCIESPGHAVFICASSTRLCTARQEFLSNVRMRLPGFNAPQQDDQALDALRVLMEDTAILDLIGAFAQIVVHSYDSLDAV
ncbi:unnamed protein product [Peniophora sp. CBMAI 1063]|nr:unnamed protein product [Peniophora sp. CBMAI 1063]